MVNINGEFSSPTKIVCGVPQGSCLGPMLFSLFINDLPSVLDTASITLYADDSTPYHVAEDVNLISENLNNDLLNVEEWIQKNRLVLNVEKTKSILIGGRQRIKVAQPLNLSMKHKSITQYSCVKLLGVQMDEALSWKPHCDGLLKDCSKALSLLYRFSKYIPKTALRSIADALILSKLNHCCTVWGSALNRNSLDFLQILQNKVARLIVGCKIHEKSRKELHNELNWLTVRQRIHMRTAMIIHRTLYWKEPFTIFMHLHPLIITHEHETRFASKCKDDKLLLTKPVYKKKTFLARAFTTRGIEIWNNLSVETKHTVMKGAFKSALCRQLAWFILYIYRISTAIAIVMTKFYIVILYSIVVFCKLYIYIY